MSGGQPTNAFVYGTRGYTKFLLRLIQYDVLNGFHGFLFHGIDAVLVVAFTDGTFHPVCDIAGVCEMLLCDIPVLTADDLCKQIHLIVPDKADRRNVQGCGDDIGVHSCGDYGAVSGNFFHQFSCAENMMSDVFAAAASHFF